MASDKLVSLLKQDVDAWNGWRRRNPLIIANLSQADLSGANLRWVNLSMMHLRKANLSGADLRDADLSVADLRDADLSGTDLDGANLRGARLRRANLRGANLTQASLSDVDLSLADLNGTIFSETNLGHVSLENAIGLDNCQHSGPSTINFSTLYISNNLPISFLRGCGLPDVLIEYLPSLRGDGLQFYSCQR
jgi:uncharacterized protein YjbI with pentapeptide repeats